MKDLSKRRPRPRRAQAIAIGVLIASVASGCGGGGGGSSAGSRTVETNVSISPTTTSPTPTPAPVTSSPIDGEYVMTLTRQEGLDAGLRPGTASSIAGDWRLSLSFAYAQQFVNIGGGGITVDGYIGAFSVDGHRLVFTDQPGLVFGWDLVGRQLTLTPVDGTRKDPVERLIWTSHPWKLVGT